MASICIESCIKDTRVPVRATYVNLYKWPESDAEFVKSVTDAAKGSGNGMKCAPVVDSISCRQLYLRSYTFSKKETVPEKTMKCFGKVKEKVNYRGGRRKMRRRSFGKRCLVIRKVKEMSCAAFFSVFDRLLACTASVDVVDRKNM